MVMNRIQYQLGLYFCNGLVPRRNARMRRNRLAGPRAFPVPAARRGIDNFTLESARLELMFPIGELMGLATHHADLACKYVSICCTVG